MNATAALVDTAEVRAFMELVHAQAARALEGATRPGVLQLVSIHPSGGSAVSTRFAIGQIDRMVEAAIDDAQAGTNVYIETRTTAHTGTGRGRTADTRGVFAFVVDADADKGKA